MPGIEPRAAEVESGMFTTTPHWVKKHDLFIDTFYLNTLPWEHVSVVFESLDAFDLSIVRALFVRQDQILTRCG